MAFHAGRLGGLERACHPVGGELLDAVAHLGHMHSSGLQYTDGNIGRLLEERHMVKELRRTSRNSNLRGVKSLMRKDDGGLKGVLNKLIQEASARERES